MEAILLSYINETYYMFLSNAPLNSQYIPDKSKAKQQHLYNNVCHCLIAKRLTYDYFQDGWLGLTCKLYFG